MLRLNTFVVTLLLCSQALWAAQWPALRVSDDGQLTISATPERKRPHRIHVRLTNRSTHDFLLPMPERNCGDALHGTLSIWTTELKPVLDNTGTGCVHDFFGPGAAIDARIQGWYRLAPGRSLEFYDDLPRITLAHQPAKIAYRAQYDPPYVSAADRNLLERARIAVPRSELSTEWRTFSFNPRH